LAVEKRLTSTLLEPSSVEKIMEIDTHLGCAMSGLVADARTMIEHARVETQVCFQNLTLSTTDSLTMNQ
jgi:20S proteasome subunit alpha 5